jgi:RNA-directed DNA polymerase
MPMEGRGLSSRQTQDVAGDQEIGQPINSEERPEAADGVHAKAEKGAGTWLPLLCPVRQDQPRRHPAHAYALCRSNQGRREWTDRTSPRSRGTGWRAGWGNCACSEGRDLPTGPHLDMCNPEGQRQTAATGHLDLAGSGLHDSGDAGAGADLRSRLPTEQYAYRPGRNAQQAAVAVEDLLYHR